MEAFTKNLFISIVFIFAILIAPAQAQKFKLGAAASESQYAPSHVGIIGLRYLHRAGSTSEVVEIYPNTPADKSNIRLGDKILAVNGINVSNYDANGVHSLMTGAPGTPVELTMMNCSYRCQTYTTRLMRMDMNEIASDNIFNIYKMGW